MGSVGGWEKQFPEVASFFSFHPNWTRLGILPEIEITHQWRRLTFTTGGSRRQEWLNTWLGTWTSSDLSRALVLPWTYPSSFSPGSCLLSGETNNVQIQIMYISLSKMGTRARWTFSQMSKSASPNTLVISSSAVSVLIDLINQIKSNQIKSVMMVIKGTMMVTMNMMSDLTYVSIWVSPMLVLKRLSLSFACNAQEL